MKMEVLAVQSSYGVIGSNKVKDWTSTLTPPPTSKTATNKHNINNNNNNNIINNNNNNKNSINNNNNNINNKKMKRTTPEMCSNKRIHQQQQQQQPSYNQQRATAATASTAAATAAQSQSQPTLFYCDDIDQAAVNELSMRLLDELRAAKSRHLTCTEVSLPCDLTPNIAAEIIRVSEKEPCGIRGCTIYIEFEDEPNNSRRIASLKLDPETVSTFEVYLTLRQDHRGWSSLLRTLMKSLVRTITISPEYTITKHKLYATQQRSSYNFNSSTSAAIATPLS